MCSHHTDRKIHWDIIAVYRLKEYNYPRIMIAERPNPQEQSQAYYDLYAQINDRVLEYRLMTGEIVDAAVNFINQRALFAESDTVRRRQDAFEVTRLYRSVQRILIDIEDTGWLSGVFPPDYESGNHGFIAKTAIYLLRQQIYNWQGVGEEMSLITLYDVQASLRRQFYGIYLKQREAPNERKKSYLDMVYDTHAVVSAAINIERDFSYEPQEQQDMSYWNPFLSDVTYVK